MRSTGLLVCLALVLVGVLWFVRHEDNHRSAQTVSSLPAPPTPHRTEGTCATPPWSPKVTGGRTGRVSVSPQPTAAFAYWLPGLNSKKCRVVVTKLTEGQAASLAADVRDSTYRRGAYSCPADDDSTVWIFFRYADRTGYEVVSAQLTGCSFAGAPHRGEVGPFWRGTDELRALRPAGV